MLNRLYYRPTCIRVLTTSAGWVTRLAMIPAPVLSGFTTILQRFIVDIYERCIPRPARKWQVFGEASILEGISCFSIS